MPALAKPFLTSWLCAITLALLFPCAGAAYRVYILRGGDPASDDAVRQAIQDRGHDANLGINGSDFDGTQVKLSDFDVVVLLDNKSIIGRMPVAGRAAIRDYLLGGGRVVTGEGVIYDLGGDSALGPLWPATGCGTGPSITQITYTQVVPIDPIVNAGMPASFSLPLDNYAGNCLAPVGGARAFYQADTRQSGTLVPSLVGRVLPSGGRVMSFSVIIGLFELQSADFKRLLVNAIEWAAAGTTTSPASLAARPATMSFNYELGGTPSALQLLSISSSGASASFSAAASTATGAGWLSVSPQNGATPAMLSVSVNPSGLPPGAYTGTINVTGPGSAARTVAVNLTVASAVKVYIFSGGDSASDNAVSQAIQDRGHSPNLGVSSGSFDGTQVSLTDYDIVVLLDNRSIIGRMPVAGRAALRDYLLGGGRVVTGEGVIYDLGGDATLGPLWPATGCGTGPSINSIGYTQVG